MNGQSVLIFREKQKFAAWLRLLIYVSMAYAVFISIVSLQNEFAGQDPPRTNVIRSAVIVGICVPVIIAMLFLLLKLETEVRPDGLYVRYFPFHLHFKRFSPNDISESYARQYKPILEYGGWGLRYSLRNGKAYNTSGNKGIQLIFKNGKRLLIGSQKAEELEQAIRSIMSK